MAYIITGLIICVFSTGLLTHSDLMLWGIAGIGIGVFLIVKGRAKPGTDD